MIDFPEHIEHDDILFRYLASEVSQEERATIESRLKTDEGYRNYFEKIKTIWETTKEAELRKQIDVDSAIHKFLEKAGFETEKTSPIEPKTHSQKQNLIVITKRILPIAAILIIGIIIWQVMRNDNQEPEIVEQTIESGKKQNKLCILPDSSKVYLNKHTKIRYTEEFNNKTRSVFLSGEAFFNVSPNNSIPFIVNTNYAKIEVTGTQFTVKAFDNDTAVVVHVSGGEVLVRSKINGDKPNGTKLTAGKSGFVTQQSPNVHLLEDFDINSISWNTGKLTFVDMPLEQVAEILEKNYSKAVVFLNPELKKCELTANFDNRTFESILEVIQLTFNLQTHFVNDSTVELNGGGCE